MMSVRALIATHMKLSGGTMLLYCILVYTLCKKSHTLSFTVTLTFLHKYAQNLASKKEKHIHCVEKMYQL